MSEDTAAELSRMQRLLRAREGKPGYKANTEALKAKIAELQEQPASE